MRALTRWTRTPRVRALIRRCDLAAIGVAVERLMIRRIYNRDPVYSLLLTFGLAFISYALLTKLLPQKSPQRIPAAAA